MLRHTVREMRSLLDEALSLPVGLGREEGRTHEFLQDQLAALGDRLGYEVAVELPIDHPPGPWYGRIDVAFSRPGEDFPAHAFEIDYNPKRKSVAKLTQTNRRTVPWIIVFDEKRKHSTFLGAPEWVQVYVVRRNPAPAANSKQDLPTLECRAKGGSGFPYPV